MFIGREHKRTPPPISNFSQSTSLKHDGYQFVWFLHEILDWTSLPRHLNFGRITPKMTETESRENLPCLYWIQSNCSQLNLSLLQTSHALSSSFSWASSYFWSSTTSYHAIYERSWSVITSNRKLRKYEATKIPFNWGKYRLKKKQMANLKGNFKIKLNK